MATVRVPSVYDELIEYFAKHATPQEILDFSISETAQERAEELLTRNSEDTITPDERIELEQMLHFDGIISVLKAKAMERLG